MPVSPTTIQAQIDKVKSPVIFDALGQNPNSQYGQAIRQILTQLNQLASSGGDVTLLDKSGVTGPLTLLASDFDGALTLMVLFTNSVTYVLLPPGVVVGTRLILNCANGLVAVGAQAGSSINGIEGNGVAAGTNPSTVTPAGSPAGGLILTTDGTNWFTTGNLSLA